MAVATEYRGMTMAELTDLRRSLRKAGVEFHVVKNTLARIAAEQAGNPALKEILTGPSALAIGGEDQVAPAKALNDYVRANPRTLLKVVGGVLDGKALTPAQVTALATLPSREELIAKMLGSMNSPIANLVGVLGGPVRALTYVLQARQRQLGEGGA
jgi:large subunit ribosomal protein L10